MTAQFEALASTRLPDGEWLPLGPMAAEWASAPFDAEAKRTEDEKFAGHFDRRGRFLPSAAGPNPAREFSGDNVGNLAVVAQVAGEPAAVEGTCAPGRDRAALEHSADLLRPPCKPCPRRLEWNSWNGHLVRGEADAYLLHVPTTAVFGVDALGLSVIEQCRETRWPQRR